MGYMYKIDPHRHANRGRDVIAFEAIKEKWLPICKKLDGNLVQRPDEFFDLFWHR